MIKSNEHITKKSWTNWNTERIHNKKIKDHLTCTMKMNSVTKNAKSVTKNTEHVMKNT